MNKKTLHASLQCATSGVLFFRGGLGVANCLQQTSLVVAGSGETFDFQRTSRNYGVGTCTGPFKYQLLPPAWIYISISE